MVHSMYRKVNVCHLLKKSIVNRIDIFKINNLVETGQPVSIEGGAECIGLLPTTACV